jgi:hypothetical protein
LGRFDRRRRGNHQRGSFRKRLRVAWFRRSGRLGERLHAGLGARHGTRFLAIGRGLPILDRLGRRERLGLEPTAFLTRFLKIPALIALAAGRAAGLGAIGGGPRLVASTATATPAAAARVALTAFPRLLV